MAGVPIAGRADPASLEEQITAFRRMADEAGRDPATLPVSLFGGPDNEDTLKRYRDLGVARVVVALPSAGADQVLPLLDKWQGLARKVNG